MGKKFRVVESAKDKMKRLNNVDVFNQHMEYLRNEYSDFRTKSIELFGSSKFLRLSKSHVLIRELMTIHAKKETFNAFDQKIELKEPLVIKDATEIVRLFDRVYDKNKKLDQREFVKRRNAFNLKYREFEFNLRTFFDTTEILLNALCLNWNDVKQYNEIIKELFRERMLSISEFNSLKMFGQLRNLFLHNDPNDVINESLTTDKFSFYKAVFTRTYEIVNSISSTYKYRLLFYVAKVNLEEDEIRDENVTKENLKMVLDQVYVLMVNENENLGISHEGDILTDEEKESAVNQYKNKMFSDFEKDLEEFKDEPIPGNISVTEGLAMVASSPEKLMQLKMLINSNEMVKVMESSSGVKLTDKELNGLREIINKL